MQVEKKFVDGCIIVTYKPSNREVEILQSFKNQGYMEFKGSYGTKMEDWTSQTGEFKLREIDGLENEFLAQDYDAWHTTYKLTELGRFYLENI